MNQYFISKIKDEYLPNYIKENMMKEEKIKRFLPWSDIFWIDLKYFRKLKISNIQNQLDGDDKLLLEFLLNENYTDLLTNEEFEKRKTGYSGTSYTSGTSSTTGNGMSGIYGVYGVSAPYLELIEDLSIKYIKK